MPFPRGNERRNRGREAAYIGSAPREAAYIGSAPREAAYIGSAPREAAYIGSARREAAYIWACPRIMLQKWCVFAHLSFHNALAANLETRSFLKGLGVKLFSEYGRGFFSGLYLESLAKSLE